MGVLNDEVTVVKRATGSLLATLPQAPDTELLPLYLQLYRRLRDGIVSGAIKSGSRLPSSRSLAADLGVSRNTVEGAITQLRAEGFLTRRVGAGTYVSAQAVQPMVGARAALATRGRKRSALATGQSHHGLSTRGRAIASFSDPATAPEGRALAETAPAHEEFPLHAWLTTVSRCARRGRRDLLGPMRAEGYTPLRQAVAAHLAAARGVRCDWRQVIITSSTQQSLDLAAHLVLDPGDWVCCENPCYAGARAALQFAGARFVPVAVDAQGADFQAVAEPGRDARLAYVTPSHQYPLGITMSLERRLALLRWADEGGRWIFEDDYDSEFRYVGRPIMSVQGLDQRQRVIYSGSLNKVLFPTIRLAYLVVPEALVDPFGHIIVAAAGPAPTLTQAAAAEFISAGHLAAHIRRTRERYRERRDVLLDALEQELGGVFQVITADAGMHVTGWLPPEYDDVDIARRASREGLEVPPLSSYYIGQPSRTGLLIHFARVAPPVIRRSIAVLAKCVKQSVKRRAS